MDSPAKTSTEIPASERILNLALMLDVFTRALHGKARVTTPPGLAERVKQLALKKIAELEEDI